MAISANGPWQIIEIFEARGREITPKQAKLLNALLGNERVVSTEELIDAIWCYDPMGGPTWAGNSLRSLIYKARQHIRRAGVPWRIDSIYGRGYKLTYLQVEDDARLAA